MKVLLVEDEFIISMLTEDMLNELGHVVSMSAATLEDGLQFAEEGAFDLAVLDVNLNGVTSYPIADVLTERSIPFIFASGYAALGIDGRFPGILKLQKPFTLAGLQNILSRAIESKDSVPVSALSARRS